MTTTDEQRAVNREKMRRFRWTHPDYFRELQRSRRAAGLVQPESPDERRVRRARAMADPAKRERERERQREVKRRARAADPERARETARLWRESNPERAAEVRRAGVARYNQRVRVAVLDHYGRECACCGSTDRLQIDHVDGRGREHRQELFGNQRAGPPFYAWLIKQGFPAGFQSLCLRCNRSKGDGPACRLTHEEVMSA
jgi:hypothetical protein